MSENYLNAISPNELERLQMQHQAWKPYTDAFLRRAGFEIRDVQAVSTFASSSGSTWSCFIKEDS